MMCGGDAAMLRVTVAWLSHHYQDQHGVSNAEPDTGERCVRIAIMIEAHVWLRRLRLVIHQTHSAADVVILIVPVLHKLLGVPAYGTRCPNPPGAHPHLAA